MTSQAASTPQIEPGDFSENEVFANPVLAEMIRMGLPLTREQFIALNWSDTLDPWTAEDEEQVPSLLQNWDQFDGPPE